MQYILSAADPRIRPEYYGMAIVLALGLGTCLNRHCRQGRLSKERAVALLFLIEYTFLVFASTVFSRNVRGYYAYKPIPFWSYWRILHGSKGLFWEDVFNVILLMPIGVLLPVVWKRARSPGRVAAVGFLVSLTIEVLQLILRRGLFEFDDLFHNTCGAWIGYWIYQSIKKRNIPGAIRGFRRQILCWKERIEE